MWWILREEQAKFSLINYPLDGWDRVNKKTCQFRLCRRCHFAAHTHIHTNSSKRHLLGENSTAQAPRSQSGIKSWQHMPTKVTLHTPDLEQSGQHNSIWAWPETQVSPWATLQHADETGWHCSTNRPELWAWQPAAMISSRHYLPGRSRVQSHRNMHATSTKTHGADLKAMSRLSPKWLIVRSLDAVNCGDRNKRIRHKKKQQNLAMSQSLFESDSMKRQETVTPVLWRSQTCTSVCTWFIRAGTDTTSLCPHANSRFMKVETRK